MTVGTERHRPGRRREHTERPEMAVVVISLANEPGLVPAARSVLEQDVPVELVVVNSGGGDPGAVLAAAGIDAPVVNRPQRLYGGAARNLGIEATRAPYVAFLASDCLAEPGWVAARLSVHRLGARAVASAMVNPFPHSRSACAAFLLLHHRRMPSAPLAERKLYGVSYERSLFAQFGRFREDLRAGEDSDFNARFEAALEIRWAPDVRTAHRYPARPDILLRDQYRRGFRQAAILQQMRGRRQSIRLAADALLNVVWCLRNVLGISDAAERRRLLHAWPLLVPAAAAYALGAATERWVKNTDSAI